MLARLHRLDPDEVGLGDLGRPDGYLARQLSRWTRQLASSKSRELPELARLADRLAVDVPDEPAATRSCTATTGWTTWSWTPRRGHIVAVLDWEMATLGDPLADVASMVAWWDGMRGLDSPVAEIPGDVPGYPASADLLDRYARQSGLDLAPLPWYVGFAFFKIAAIFEGIHYRAQQGLTIGEGSSSSATWCRRWSSAATRRWADGSAGMPGLLCHPTVQFATRPGRALPPTARARGRAPTPRPAAPRSGPCALTAT